MGEAGKGEEVEEVKNKEAGAGKGMPGAGDLSGAESAEAGGLSGGVGEAATWEEPKNAHQSPSRTF